MRARRRFLPVAVFLFFLWPTASPALELELTAIQYPERRAVSLDFTPRAAHPAASLTGRVSFRDGQGQIDISYDRTKPAVLFGGTVTSYVVWAIYRDALVENLGELPVRESGRGRTGFTTSGNNFALVVTAETHPLAVQPSELVLAVARAGDLRGGRSSAFRFSDFAAAPAHEHSSLTAQRYDEDVPVELVQARRMMAVAEERGAPEHASDTVREARTALAQANNIAAARGGSRTTIVDYARRSVALSSEAVRTTERRLEALELERQIAERRAEMAGLQERVAEAELRMQDAEAEMGRARLAQEQLQAETARLEQEKSELEATMAEIEAEAELQRTAAADLAAELEALRIEREGLAAATSQLEDAVTEQRAEAARLEAEKALVEEDLVGLTAEHARLEEAVAEQRALAERLETEKERLADRLEGALSQVAETRHSARGIIVNLPDILFAFDSSDLKPESRVTLAKLAGILLIMPDLNLRVEGHTDSVGSPAYNLRLSERRAESVFNFLAEQGISVTRMRTAGYGMERPMASNDTEQGRARNRRVEIVIGEGEIREAAAGES